jgi:hypothetical protein
MLGFELPKVLCEDRHIYRGTKKRRRLKGRMQSLVARVLSLFTPLRLVILFVKHLQVEVTASMAIGLPSEAPRLPQ